MPRTIPCNGEPLIHPPSELRDNERVHKVATWIVNKNIPVAGYIREQLERISIRDPRAYIHACLATRSVINTYEPEVQ